MKRGNETLAYDIREIGYPKERKYNVLFQVYSRNYDEPTFTETNGQCRNKLQE